MERSNELIKRDFILHVKIIFYKMNLSNELKKRDFIFRVKINFHKRKKYCYEIFVYVLYKNF